MKIKIYNPDGSTNLLPYKNKTGVYKIFSGKLDKIPVYVGSCNKKKQGLYKTILRHFQAWETGLKRGNKSVTFRNKQNYYVIIEETTAKTARAKESALIQKHKPRKNRTIKAMRKSREDRKKPF
jgi:hypothetical protein